MWNIKHKASFAEDEKNVIFDVILIENATIDFF